MPTVLGTLLQSRKFWIAGFGVITAIVSYYLKVPQEIWVPIEVLVMTLITAITVEDSALKLGGRRPDDLTVLDFTEIETNLTPEQYDDLVDQLRSDL